LVFHAKQFIQLYFRWTVGGDTDLAVWIAISLQFVFYFVAT